MEFLPPRPGDRVGSYVLLREIGRGGMGSVWSAEHGTLGRTVAVKFIDAKCDGEDARRRFEREAIAAARIRSKHVVHVYDHGIDEGRPYIVMEWLAGESLGTRLQRCNALPLRQALGLLCDIGRALSKAHEQGVVHRDLKPDNVFLCADEDSGQEVAKVLDFGIAKLLREPGELGANASLGGRTQTGTLLGTPYYMSPEQARGASDIDARSDLWAFGVIAGQCLTGSLPFSGASLGDLLVKICTAEPTMPSAFRPELPEAFDRWMARALQKDPALRFSNASEMCDALCDALGPKQAAAPTLDVAPFAPLDPYGAGATLPLSTPVAVSLDPLVRSHLEGRGLPSHKSRRAIYGLAAAGLALLLGAAVIVLRGDLSLSGSGPVATAEQATPPLAVALQAPLLVEAPVSTAPAVMQASDAGAPQPPKPAPRPAVPMPKPPPRPPMSGEDPGF